MKAASWRGGRFGRYQHGRGTGRLLSWHTGPAGHQGQVKWTYRVHVPSGTTT